MSPDRACEGVMLAAFNFMLLALLIIANASIVYLFVQRKASSRWIVTLLAAWVVGALLGCPSSKIEYRTESHMVIVGFPLMSAFQLEVSPGLPPEALPWVEHLIDVPPIMIGVNMTAMAMLFACPVGLWFYLGARPSRAPTYETNGTP